ncbi:MAG: glycoside hydrolase family 31 protein [Clostridia bacterium]|nr:glycoside hydrolase family 31 protein [Clostridia bacterium]
MKRSMRYLAAALCLLLAMSLLSCTLKYEKPEEGSSFTSEETTTAPVIPIPEDLLAVAENGESEYQIVYPVGASQGIVDASNTLADEIEAATGARPSVVHDSMPEQEKEILVGDVFRTELMSVKNGYELKNLDYAVCVEGTRIVIMGKNDYATQTAVQFFLNTVAYKNGEAKCFGIEEAYRYIYRSDEVHPVMLLEKGDRYADFAVGITGGAPTLFRLTYTGNDGWRIQTKASMSDEYDDIGASQLLSVYLNEEPYLNTESFSVQKEEASVLFRAPDGSSGKILLDKFQAEFYTPDGALAATLTDIDATREESYLEGELLDNEAIFGTGERFDTVNQRGKRLEMFTADVWSSSQANYVVTPLFCFSRGSGVFVNRYEYMVADLGSTVENRWSVRVQGAQMDCYVFTTEKIGDAIYGYTEISGHAEQPAEWTYGMIVCRYDPDLTQKWSADITPGADGRHTGVYDLIAKMEEYDLPWSGLLVEMWGKYPSANHERDLEELCDYVHSIGKKMVGYIPVGGISWNMPGVSPDYYLKITLPNGLQTEQIPQTTSGVVNPDNDGTKKRTYVDITNPEAVEWYFDEYYAHLIHNVGVDGYKIDFCEQIPENYPINYYGSRFPTLGSHHWYPTAFCARFWEMLCDKPDGGMCYIRGGGIGLQRSPYVWGGDQTRDMYCLPWLVKATLSMGLSGLPFFSFDMSGYQYRGYNCLTKNVWEEAKVFVRGTSMAAFTICLQTHGKVRNCYDFADQGVPYATDVYRGYLKLHELLTPYFTELSENACATGMPIMRHMVLHWQEDETVYDIDDQYLLGDAFLVAPVLTDWNTRDIYLPEGKWIDLNTGETYTVGKGGKWLYNYYASLAELPVFFNTETSSDTARNLVPGIEEIFDYLETIDVPE